jgi:F-box-like
MAGLSSSNLANMDGSLTKLKNYVPVYENRTLVLEIIKDQEEVLHFLQQKFDKAHIRHKAAKAEVDRARERLALAENAALISKVEYDSTGRAVLDVQGRIASQKALLHPIRRLAPEILHEIFKHCLIYRSHTRNMTTSIRIAAVCRAWRLAACSLQPLWNEIYLDASDGRCVKIVKLCMKRSSQSISLAVDSPLWSKSAFHFSFSLERFPLSRITRLSIQSCFDTDVLGMDSWAYTFPNVTHLMIWAYEDDCSLPVHGNFLSYFPKLEDLELDGLDISFDTDFQLSAWQRMTWFVNKKHISPSSLHNSLSHSPGIKSLIFSGGTPARLLPSTTSNLTPGPFLALNHLQIDFPEIYFAMTNILEFPESLPALEHLSLAWTSGDLPVDRFSNFFEYHGTTNCLKHLEVMLDQYQRVDNLVEAFNILRHLRLLTQLSITEPAITAEDELENADELEDEDELEEGDELIGNDTIHVICGILSSPDPDPIFPALRGIRFVGNIAIPVEDIIDMAIARISMSQSSSGEIARLESVEFKDCEPLSVNEDTRLRKALSGASM